jgi:molecular chaperone HscB
MQASREFARTSEMTQTQLQSAGVVCWACGAEHGIGAPLCPTCNKVQPLVAGADYFTALGLPRLLQIDVAALEKQFYRLSRRLHPDLYATAGADQQQWSTEQSSLLNDAYRTLKDPVERTRYLLQLEGASVEEESEKDRAAAKAAGTAREQKVPADLLEEVFDLNMQLEELRMGGEDADLKRQLQTARNGFTAQLAACDEQLRQQLWQLWDAAWKSADESGKAAAKDKMVALLNRRNYIRNLVRDVNEALGE